jgi:hypothetical protein
MGKADAIGRIVISLILLVMAGFILGCSMRSTDVGEAKAMIGISSGIISGNMTFWLAPRVQIVERGRK